MTTIRDVAKRAGVSVKTVSRVINSEPMVGQRTRARVRQAVQELGYTPNVLAQRLARGRSMTILLLFNDATWAYLGYVLYGSLAVARPAGYSIVTHQFEPADPSYRQDVLDMVAQRRVDGILFTPPCDNAPELLDDLSRQGTPCVRLTPHNRQLPLPHVTASDRAGARDATRYLLALGHRRIGLVAGNRAHSASSERLAGFREALDAAGVPFDAELVQVGDWSFQSGMAGARGLLALRPRPTAIFAGNDDMAAGVLSVARQQRLAVPDDLSVIGFDDIPLARQVSPPLTTVRQPILELAQLACRVLVDAMAGRAPARLHHELPTELVIRESTGPAPAADRLVLPGDVGAGRYRSAVIERG
jgi:LacI family transcriptional regulator